MEHTQGKWEVKHWDGEQWPDRRWSVSVNEGGISKAICISPRYFTHEPESLANAQLIAAAPETAAERDQLKADLKLINDCWQTDIKEVIRLKEINAELLEALETALNYVDVFLIRGEEPLLGDNIKTDSFKIRSAISNAKSL